MVLTPARYGLAHRPFAERFLPSDTHCWLTHELPPFSPTERNHFPSLQQAWPRDLVLASETGAGSCWEALPFPNRLPRACPSFPSWNVELAQKPHCHLGSAEDGQEERLRSGPAFPWGKRSPACLGNGSTRKAMSHLGQPLTAHEMGAAVIMTA